MITVGPLGDFHDVPPGECAVRMARAGADVVGTNCYFDPRNGVQLLSHIWMLRYRVRHGLS